MPLSLVDYLVLAVLLLVVPLAAWLSWPRSRARLLAGARISEYRRTMFWEWLVAFALLGSWYALDRSWADLGLSLGGTASSSNAGIQGPWLVPVAIGSIALSCFLVLQVRALADPPTRAAVRAQLAPLRFMLPQDRRELWVFLQLAVTAGICEEIAYRGYLMFVLDALGGPWLAVLGSTVAFTLGHLYQHGAGIVRVAGVGLIAAVMMWAGGSLLPIILLHIVTDVTSGVMAWRVAQADQPEAAAQAG